MAKEVFANQAICRSSGNHPVFSIPQISHRDVRKKSCAIRDIHHDDILSVGLEVVGISPQERRKSPAVQGGARFAIYADHAIPTRLRSKCTTRMALWAMACAGSPISSARASESRAPICADLKNREA